MIADLLTPTIRFLPREEYGKLAVDSAELPTDNAEVLVLEVDGKVIASLNFHTIFALGATYVDPEWRRDGATVLKLMGEAIEQMFACRHEPLFIPIADGESPALVKQFGCVRIGELYRKDF